MSLYYSKTHMHSEKCKKKPINPNKTSRGLRGVDPLKCEYLIKSKENN